MSDTDGIDTDKIDTDRIEKQIVLRAQRSRVWRALTDALRIVESGFDQLPPGRRNEAFRMNEGGWAEQAQNIARHVASA